MRVIRNREQGELLFVNEIRVAKAEVLIATSSLSYLRRLDGLGLLDSLELAKSRGVGVLILCPELERSEERNAKSAQQLMQDLQRYSQIRCISGQIKGSIILTDNSRVLSISEEGIDALTIYSDNKSLVNNFGSLFEALWIQKDILSDLLKSKNNLLQSNEQLIRRDEMQNEFINIAAHELRTPVQPLLVIAELIRKDLDDKDSVTVGKKRAEILIRSAKKLERLTTDILEVSRIESKSMVLSRESFNLSKKLEDAIADMKSLIVPEQVRIVYTPPGTQVFVNADASKISQVITNLLRNAIKFTNEGIIELGLDVNIEDKEALVTIADNGPGIDPLIMPRLFTKFSSRGQLGGTGLGLYISKAIVEAHGGRIWGENNTNAKGATFAFTLPLVELVNA